MLVCQQQCPTIMLKGIQLPKDRIRAYKINLKFGTAQSTSNSYAKYLLSLQKLFLAWISPADSRSARSFS